MPADWNPEDDVVNDLIDRLPPEILETFTPDQRAALWSAAKPSTWHSHPVDIRFTLPLVGLKVFLTVVSGAERRGRSRRVRDAWLHPVFTPVNTLFLIVLIALSVALGTVLNDVLAWLATQIHMIAPSAGGLVAPK
jgi:hypothetical protein